jgi:hypothetical protein
MGTLTCKIRQRV